MNVVHFTPIYIDNWGYQDNLFPKYFKLAGHEVYVITPKKLPKNLQQKQNTSSLYFINEVEIRRIKTWFYLTFSCLGTMGLYRNFKEIKPDIIFHHSISLNSLLVCSLYKIFHRNCILVVDNHTDKINEVKSRLLRNIYSRFLLRYLNLIISPLVSKYYGVTYGRCDYLEETFKLKKNKIKFLPIGADTLSVDKIGLTKNEIRDKYSMGQNYWILVSGGKMGQTKGTDVLIQAVDEMSLTVKNIKLVLFGTIEDEITTELVANSKSTIQFGWCDRNSTLEILTMADCAIWPQHHTTLVEDCIACSTPIILRKTRTTEHLIDGNGVFIDNCNISEIKNAISQIQNSNSLNEDCSKMKVKIDYQTLVNTVIEDCLAAKKKTS